VNLGHPIVTKGDSVA